MVKNDQKHNIFHYLATVLVYIIKGIISEFIWILVATCGYLIYQIHKSPYDLVFGLPLIAIGVSFVIHAFLSEWLAVFSSIFNKGVCVICGKSSNPEA